MGIEIERKFLVCNDAWRKQADGPGRAIRQGYLTVTQQSTVRVRVIGEDAVITIKGKSTGMRRSEFEYPIPMADAEHMLAQLCRKPVIDKIRYRLPAGGLVWEVDDYFGENAGLVTAEIELQDEAQTFDFPPWLGREVTGTARYYNSALARQPFSKWPAEDRLPAQRE